MTSPRRYLRYLGQGVVYLLIAVLIGYFANAPSYTRVPPENALIKLSFAHGAGHKGKCRQLTEQEMAKLPPNMKKKEICPRERLPVLVEFEVDGQLLYAESLKPTGLSGDGPSRTYQRFEIPAGRHRLAARLRDSNRNEGFDYIKEVDVELAAGQSLAIDFDAGSGGFRLEGG